VIEQSAVAVDHGKIGTMENRGQPVQRIIPKAADQCTSVYVIRLDDCPNALKTIRSSREPRSHPHMSLMLS
jgi:hypothetical protein